VKVFLILLPLLYLSNSYANLSQNELEGLLLNTIYSELHNRVEQTPHMEGSQIPSNTKESKGSLYVAQMKEANRIKIAKMRGIDPNLAKSGKDLVALQKSDNKKFIKHINKVRNKLEILKNRTLMKSEWRVKFNELKNKWDQEKIEYIKNLKIYQKNAIDLPVMLTAKNTEQSKKTKIILDKEYHFVKDSLNLEIKDQGDRSTCSAFSGIRAIEVLLNQQGKKPDLSEQYFYWASKPKCQKSPCTKKGSWVGFGLDHSQLSKGLDIPKEDKCEYNDKSIKDNETQIPLASGCLKGIVKVDGFSYLKNLDEVLTKLKNNKAVVISIKLTPNFYQNNGLILSSESSVGPEMDDHSKGHSLILTGAVKIPSLLNEGSYCFIVSNSWGLGWAIGGHSCISEKWILKNRQPNLFVSIDSVTY